MAMIASDTPGDGLVYIGSYGPATWQSIQTIIRHALNSFLTEESSSCRPRPRHNQSPSLAWPAASLAMLALLNDFGSCVRKLEILGPRCLRQGTMKMHSFILDQKILDPYVRPRTVLILLKSHQLMANFMF